MWRRYTRAKPGTDRHAESTPGLAQGSSILSRLIQTTLNGLSVDRGRLRTKALARSEQDVRFD